MMDNPCEVSKIVCERVETECVIEPDMCEEDLDLCIHSARLCGDKDPLPNLHP